MYDLTIFPSCFDNVVVPLNFLICEFVLFIIPCLLPACAQAGKRHGMIKRTNSQIRKLRGTTTLSKQDGKIVKSYMPYSLRG